MTPLGSGEGRAALFALHAWIPSLILRVQGDAVEQICLSNRKTPAQGGMFSPVQVLASDEKRGGKTVAAP